MWSLVYHGWGFGCHNYASTDKTGALSIEESIVPVPDEGIFHGGSMGAWSWDAQPPLRLAVVIIEMKPGQPECLSAQRDAHYPSK